jgi:hypothetical protein
VTVELRPGVGVRADGLPDVPFGVSEDQLVALLPAARPSWVCRATWARTVTLPGVTITACGGGDGSLDLFEVAHRESFVDPARRGVAPHVPVVYADVDAFGWPADEVIDFLVAEGHPVERHPQLVRVGRILTLFRWSGPRFTSLVFSGDRRPRN